MDAVARVLVLGGVALAVVGALVWAGARLGLGRLPGDIFVERGNVQFAFPLVTSLLLSIALTVVLNIALRAWR